MNKEQEYAIKIGEKISELFSEESDLYLGPVNQLDLTAFYTAYIMAGAANYSTLTGDNGDSIDFIALMNRLAFQYLLENGKVEEEQE